MSFDKIFNLTAGVYFNFYNIPEYIVSLDFISTMIWFHVKSINYPSTEGAQLQHFVEATSLCVGTVFRDIWED